MQSESCRVCCCCIDIWFIFRLSELNEIYVTVWLANTKGGQEQSQHSVHAITILILHGGDGFPLWYTEKKFLIKITAQCAGKNNAYSLCHIFTVFCCKFQAHGQEKSLENVKNTSHAHEIYCKIL